MNQYLVTVWTGNKKTSYTVGCSNLEAFAKSLYDLYDRVTIKSLGYKI